MIEFNLTVLRQEMTVLLTEENFIAMKKVYGLTNKKAVAAQLLQEIEGIYFVFEDNMFRTLLFVRDVEEFNRMISQDIAAYAEGCRAEAEYDEENQAKPINGLSALYKLLENMHPANDLNIPSLSL